MAKYKCTNVKWPQFGQIVDVEETNACGRKAVRYEVLYDGPEGTAIYTKAVFEKNFELIPERESFVLDHADLLEEVIQLNTHVKEQEALLKADKAKLLELMEGMHLNKLVAFDATITVVDGTNVQTFDTKGFKKDYPKLYEKYAVPSYKNSYITIR